MADSACAPDVPLCPQPEAEKATSKEGSPGPMRRCCGITACAVLLALSFFHILIYRKFTPVYTETECGDISASLDKLHFDLSDLHVSLLVRVHCTNPNPYKIDILTSSPGRVFVSKQQQPLGDLIQVGELQVVPGSYLNEYGTGLVQVRMDAVMPNHMIPVFLENSVIPILMELQFKVGIFVSFSGIGSWATEAPYKKACGMNIAGVFVSRFTSLFRESPSRLGALVCRPSFEDMTIPPIGEAVPADGKMGFAAAQIAPDEIRAGELVKNMSLGFAISCCFLGALLSFYSSFFYFPAFRKQELSCELPGESSQGTRLNSLPTFPFALCNYTRVGDQSFMPVSPEQDLEEGSSVKTVLPKQPKDRREVPLDDDLYGDAGVPSPVAPRAHSAVDLGETHLHRSGQFTDADTKKRPNLLQQERASSLDGIRKGSKNRGVARGEGAATLGADFGSDRTDRRRSTSSREGSRQDGQQGLPRRGRSHSGSDHELRERSTSTQGSGVRSGQASGRAGDRGHQSSPALRPSAQPGENASDPAVSLRTPLKPTPETDLPEVHDGAPAEKE